MIRVEPEDRLYRGLGHSARLAVLLSVFLAEAILIYISGGLHSPLRLLMLLPVFLGSVYFGLTGGVFTALGVCVYEILQYSSERSASASFPYTFAQTLAFLLAAFVIGMFSDRLLCMIRESVFRAQEADKRAAQAEWLADTTLMMQSIPDLEPSLSAALIRLDELITFTSAAIFLRDGDDSDLQLIQAMGLPTDHIGVRTLPPPQRTLLDGRENGLITWTAADRSSKAPYADIDRTVPSGMVIPLCTLDNLIGLLFLGTQRKEGFSRKEQEALARFAEHILYPIQRGRLQAMATTDLLTGLSNRRAFWHHLRNETERVRRYMHPLSLIMIDIDHFKTINDTYGHLTGDEVLSQLGHLVKSTIRESDFAARYGGEEMAVISPETPEEEACRFAERLRRIIAETPFRTANGKTLKVTVSLGIATMPEHISDPEGLVDAADSALYRAKRTGRNRVCTASDAPCPTP